MKTGALMRRINKGVTTLALGLWIIAVAIAAGLGATGVLGVMLSGAASATVIASLRRQNIAADRVFDYGWELGARHAREHPGEQVNAR